MKITVVTPTIRKQGLECVMKSLQNQTFNLNEIEWLVELNETGVPDFNKAMNKMIKEAQGELIVSIQDYIEIPPNGLELLWEAYQKNKNALFTCPVGKTSDYSNIKWDWRKERDGKCAWNEWEIDYGAFPKEVIKKLGGFDETLDEAWGFDNCIVGMRAEMEGIEIINLRDNCAIAFDHNAFMPHPFMNKRDTMLYNHRLQQIKMGKTFDYLTESTILK